MSADRTEGPTMVGVCETCGEQQSADGYCHNKQCSRHGRTNDYMKRQPSNPSDAPRTEPMSDRMGTAPKMHACHDPLCNCAGLGSCQKPNCANGANPEAPAGNATKRTRTDWRYEFERVVSLENEKRVGIVTANLDVAMKRTRASFDFPHKGGAGVWLENESLLAIRFVLESLVDVRADLAAARSQLDELSAALADDTLRQEIIREQDVALDIGRSLLREAQQDSDLGLLHLQEASESEYAQTFVEVKPGDRIKYRMHSVGGREVFSCKIVRAWSYPHPSHEMSHIGCLGCGAAKNSDQTLNRALVDPCANVECRRCGVLNGLGSMGCPDHGAALPSSPTPATGEQTND